jgi:thiaminase/transcriptional activator TenA
MVGDVGFSERLRRDSEPAWTQACTHRFTRELADDSLDDEVFRRYLVQDYAFIETLVTLLGYAVAYAPDMEAKIRFSGFLAALTSDENDFFVRSFDALDISEQERRAPVMTETTRAFADLMLDAARSGRYEDVLAVIVPAEWVYLTWAASVADAAPKRFYLKEWIDLHTLPEFADFVAWMRQQLDQVGATLPSDRQSAVFERFQRLVELEVAFFDAAYG